MAGDLRFKPNPRAKEQLLSGSDMRRLIDRVASDAAAAAAARAPRNTGRLAESVASTVEQDGGEWVGLIYFGEWYGRLWEFGHRGRSKPFLRPGTQEALSRHGGRFKSQ